MRMAVPGKVPQNSGIGNQATEGLRLSTPDALRNLGGDSEISDTLEWHRIPGRGARNFYVADLASISS